MKQPLLSFRLNSFKAVAAWLDKTFPLPLAYFCKGWLFSLEDAWIASKTAAAVEKGIAPIQPLDPVVEPPEYHSEPSEVKGLDIISLTNGFTRNRQQDKE